MFYFSGLFLNSEETYGSPPATHARKGPVPFQEWIVTQWAKIEQQRLCYLRNNQQRLRADTYQAVQQRASTSSDATNPHEFGRRIVLPSTFIGGPRHMNQLYHILAISCLYPF